MPPPRKSVPPAALAVVATLQACALRSEPPPAIEGAPLTLQQLAVTDGALRETSPGELRTDATKVRAVAEVGDGDGAALRFTYEGPSDRDEPLEGGEMRRQIGIKLRAHDGCNLVYVMWRIEPEAKLVVSTKRNPGVEHSAECGASGYETLRPAFTVPLPKIVVGEQHELHAAIVDGFLVVRVDGRNVWVGKLDAEALSLSGPIGLRTDNGNFRMALAEKHETIPAAPTSVPP